MTSPHHIRTLTIKLGLHDSSRAPWLTTLDWWVSHALNVALYSFNVILFWIHTTKYYPHVKEYWTFFFLFCCYLTWHASVCLTNMVYVILVRHHITVWLMVAFLYSSHSSLYLLWMLLWTLCYLWKLQHPCICYVFVRKYPLITSNAVFCHRFYLGQ